MIHRSSMMFVAALGALAAAPVLAQDKVTFATNWKAQAAHGGFYQALADGTYKKAGLDVTIQQGGPQVNNRPLLPAGRIDFLMTGNLLHNFDNVKNGVPTVVVAAMFQKDPQALIAHPGQGYEKFEALKNAPVKQKILYPEGGHIINLQRPEETARDAKALGLPEVLPADADNSPQLELNRRQDIQLGAYQTTKRVVIVVSALPALEAKMLNERLALPVAEYLRRSESQTASVMIAPLLWGDFPMILGGGTVR